MNDQSFMGPKVTIITVTRNNGQSLKKAFDSVANQSYPNIEYIVIDGVSTDETLQLISQYENTISYWVSEPDKGIYNAMNKGLNYAHGELVYFLNSDDYFYDRQTIQDVVDLYLQLGKPAVIYGDVMTYSSIAGRKVGRSGRKIGLRQVQKGRVICHQAMFMQTEILKKHKFNEEYRIAADYDLQIRCLKVGYQFAYIDKIITHFSIDGLSSLSAGKQATVYEKIRIIRTHFNRCTFYCFYFFAKLKLFRMAIRGFLRRIAI
ncbi:glycosyltransferase family 2 protein [Sporomusa termitida]|uniref:WcaE: colanic acid biosynthesis glycosyltransferase WcaE n=1 Tax=Sporomusa termitida TaxID=2377 RepID=A0A517DXF3_9FIRM|nr:glycosyltransferase family 2 protein [Sporomusa termitida]QDR82044.1 wcaE: colanic acid biosynthesis glycosyltransferase WcaE [Sporomusa termitida]